MTSVPSARYTVRGFTLIELLIVVAVAAILAAVAFPAYRDYVVRSNRTIAMNTLSQVADRQEQFYVANKRYAEDLGELGFQDPLYLDRRGNRTATDGAAVIYQVTLLNTPNDVGFTVEAEARGSQAKDLKCTKFALNHRGQRSFTGTGPDCW